jgi:heme-degrading monooxygenase HmoA
LPFVPRAAIVRRLARREGDLVLEIAEVNIKTGSEEAFEEGVKKAAPLFAGAKGCLGLELKRSHESPSRYLLFVRWETIDNHVVDFRNSPAFAEWRNCVAHCFAMPPKVEHVHQVLHAFGS